MNADLQRFVHDALARGLPRPGIREALREAGWRPEEVESALGAYAEGEFPLPVPRRRPYLSARETFLYLVLFATLYTSAFNTGQVLFALIERWLPDPMRGADWRSHGQWVRGATAGMIIAFPIFLALSRAIGREVAREPEKRGSPIRKWLTYLTLFLAALVVIGDLTVLVTRVLGGELAPSFVLKVLVVGLIAGAVFRHYLGSLRREEQATGGERAGSGLLARAAAATVFAVMIAGLVLSGPPREERGRQLDARRIESLRQISGAIQSYHELRNRLPASLDTLLHMPNGVPAQAVVDPLTGRAIEYRALDSLAYELCAEFQTSGPRAGRGTFDSEFWRHETGPKCFRFEITPRRP